MEKVNIMRLCRLFGEMQKVEHCWNLAYEQVSRQVSCRAQT